MVTTGMYVSNARAGAELGWAPGHADRVEGLRALPEADPVDLP
ncbi:hypothetical protein [Streptomyces sp. NBC_01367]